MNHRASKPQSGLLTAFLLILSWNFKPILAANAKIKLKTKHSILPQQQQQQFCSFTCNNEILNTNAYSISNINSNDLEQRMESTALAWKMEEENGVCENMEIEGDEGYEFEADAAVYSCRLIMQDGEGEGESSAAIMPVFDAVIFNEGDVGNELEFSPTALDKFSTFFMSEYSTTKKLTIFTALLLPIVAVTLAVSDLNFSSSSLAEASPQSNSSIFNNDQLQKVLVYAKEKVLPMAWETLQKMAIMEFWRRIWGVVWNVVTKYWEPMWDMLPSLCNSDSVCPNWIPKVEKLLYGSIERGSKKLLEKAASERFWRTFGELRKYVDSILFGGVLFSPN